MRASHASLDTLPVRTEECGLGAVCIGDRTTEIRVVNREDVKRRNCRGRGEGRGIASRDAQPGHTLTRLLRAAVKHKGPRRVYLAEVVLEGECKVLEPRGLVAEAPVDDGGVVTIEDHRFTLSLQ